MKYLLPSFDKVSLAYFPPEEYSESSECSLHDTIYLIQFLTLLGKFGAFSERDASSISKQSKHFEKEWDTWSTTQIEKRLQWVQTHKSCRYEVSRKAKPHYEEQKKSLFGVPVCPPL